MWVLTSSEQRIIVPVESSADLEAVTLRSASTLKLQCYNNTGRLTPKAKAVILRVNMAAYMTPEQ